MTEWWEVINVWPSTVNVKNSKNTQTHSHRAHEHGASHLTTLWLATLQAANATEHI